MATNYDKETVGSGHLLKCLEPEQKPEGEQTAKPAPKPRRKLKAMRKEYYRNLIRNGK